MLFDRGGARPGGSSGRGRRGPRPAWRPHLSYFSPLFIRLSEIALASVGVDDVAAVACVSFAVVACFVAGVLFVTQSFLYGFQTDVSTARSRRLLASVLLLFFGLYVVRAGGGGSSVSFCWAAPGRLLP